MRVLALNCGSSSVKSALIDTATGRRVHEMHVDDIGTDTDFTTAVERLLKEYQSPEAVAHRVVHGGEKFITPTVVDDAVVDEIDRLSVLAPLHNPPAVAAIRQARQLLPNVPHVAVFDTAFHATLPEYAREYALPADIRQRLGIRRFGFHGINHAHVAGAVAAHLQSDLSHCRLISCHLGNGASVTAIGQGRSVDTSMGMTPLEGLMMGTRAGDVDPGVLLQLFRSEEFDAEGLDQLLNKRSGLKGITGVNDMREIERRSTAGDAQCRLAIEMYSYRVRKYIGAYAAAMGGVDVIAFTAGVGEHSAMIRSRCLEKLEFLGVMFEPSLNQAVTLSEDHPVAEISTSKSRVRVLVVRANEELEMARETAAVLVK